MQAAIQELCVPENDEKQEDSDILVPPAVQCVCACLDQASLHGCVLDLLAGLPESDVDGNQALQVCFPGLHPQN